MRSPTRTGSRVPAYARTGLPWQEPDGGFHRRSGRTDLHVTIDTDGRTTDRRTDFDDVYGDWDAPPRAGRGLRRRGTGARRGGSLGPGGASGDTGGGTIDNVSIHDTGTPGSQPVLELDATTGTFNVSDFDRRQLRRRPPTRAPPPASASTTPAPSCSPPPAPSP